MKSYHSREMPALPIRWQDTEAGACTTTCSQKRVKTEAGPTPMEKTSSDRTAKMKHLINTDTPTHVKGRLGE